MGDSPQGGSIAVRAGLRGRTSASTSARTFANTTFANTFAYWRAGLVR